MHCPLAVFTPVLGAASETFIQRHALQLYPQGTSIIYAAKHPKLYWDTDKPKYVLEERTSFRERIYDKLYFSFNDKDRRSVLDPTRTQGIVNFLKENNTKVILAEYLDQSLWLLNIAKSLDIKFFAHAHGYDVSTKLEDPFWRKEYLRYNQADGIITMNQVSKNKLILLGINEKLIDVIPYGVETSDFVREDFNNSSKINCLAVGRMVEKKAPLTLLEVFRRALATTPHLHLDYIGTGELLPQVKNFIEKHNLQNYITLHYEKPNTFVKEKMKSADIFLQHSITDPYTGDQEGLPVAILEAMSFSLPVISTYHGGIPEAVDHGHTGYLVQEGDIETMAQYLTKLAYDNRLMYTMGKASYQKYLKHYSWDAEKLSLEKLLNIG